MRKLYRSGSEGQLPFMVGRSVPGSSVKIYRMWRSLERLQRVFIAFLVIILIGGVIYAVELGRSSDTKLWRDISQNSDQVEQIGVPPENPWSGSKEIQGVSPQPEQIEDADSMKANIVKLKLRRFKGPKNGRQEAVVDAFKHAWKGYKKYAWGHDHLKPISMKYQDWFSLGLTIVDSMDTAIIMGLDNEFSEAREWVAKSLDFNQNRFVSFFETTIRVLGGLLSAYHLSGDHMFADRAADLGRRLISAYSSPSTTIPYSDVNLFAGTGKQPPWNGESSLSEITTVQLEFRDLARITGNSTYEDLAFGTSKHIHEEGCKTHDGLCYMFVSPQSGAFHDGTTVTMGARADSYYEYLLKQWLQTGKTIEWLKDDYTLSMSAMEKKLLRYSVPNKLGFVGEILVDTSYSPKMDHLACFVAGTLALGRLHGLPERHLEIAKDIGRGCQKMYQTMTGLGPEIVYFHTEGVHSDDITIKTLDAHSLLRPEAIEAWFYLYRATGDKMYQDWGWEAFRAIETYARIEHGYSSINNVKRIPVSYRDMMESFFLAETLKYLYLLFDDDMDDLPLDKFVFNTEGHPLPMYDR